MADKRDKSFPIVEVLGYHHLSPNARANVASKWCPFADNECEKFRQYGFGYCSVQYTAADDQGEPKIYAVCDHRIDGEPLRHVLDDHFGKRDHILVPEVVLTNPRASFDYVAFSSQNHNDVIAVETQSIDIRGGGVGPAWRAWVDGKPEKWREYFTKEAHVKGRRDTVAYGVNMANIYKRLGLQVGVKGSYLKGIGVPFYVLMQDRTFQYLRKRIAFNDSSDPKKWDITFVTFDYTGKVLENGQMEFVHKQTVRTTVEAYQAALSSDQGMAKADRDDFLDRVKRKVALHQ